MDDKENTIESEHTADHEKSLNNNNNTNNTPTSTDYQEINKLSSKELKKLWELRLEAITHRERGRHDLYEKKLIEALAIDPENIELLKMLGDYYFDSGKFIKAISILKKVVNTDPQNHKAVWQIWQIYLFENQLETAKLLVEKAIILKDDNPKYYISLVEILYQLWNLKDAIKALEKVLKLRPTHIDYLLWIATLHEENSEPTKAIIYYSKIIELDPMHEIAKAKLKELWT
jgi:tetratricopeptide (TPR) repeat protein